ncbi:MAG: hypothetical protein H6Q18_134 [Bacteroidetes bacterium]|nr:hypothetical protein [Bacteroidota bacterium]
MIKAIKTILKLTVVLLICLISAYVNAQSVSPEIAYLHIDRTVYVAGETLFYKLYVLDATTHKRSNISKVGYIVLRAANQNPNLKNRIEINSGISNGQFLLPDTLTSGVYQIVVYTNSMRNYGEEIFFKKEIVIVNRFDKDMNFKLIDVRNIISDDSVDIPIAIKTNKKSFSTREKVSVHINKTNIKTNFSVSVYENSTIQFSNYSIFETLNNSHNQLISNQQNIKYPVEKNTKILRGRVFDTITGENINKATVLLSCIDTVPNLEYTTTNANGIFQMPLENYYDGKELFFTIRDIPDNEHWKIVIEDEFFLSGNWKPTLNYDVAPYKDFLLKSQNIASINMIYQTNNDSIYSQPTTKKSICPQLYYCPVKSLLLSDYASLNDFNEIVVELLPQVNIHKENGKYKISVLNGSQKMLSNSDIAIFLDGVYVDDVNKIMKLGSDQITKIDVLNTERVIGNFEYRGVISIITKSNEMMRTMPAPYSLRIKNNKTSSFKNYKMDNLDSITKKNIPDFKQLLYWNPNLETKENERTDFEFYTSDNEGNFIINLEGITDEGHPISYSLHIQVINQLKPAEK